jgi:hypothetical protein
MRTVPCVLAGLPILNTSGRAGPLFGVDLLSGFDDGALGCDVAFCGGYDLAAKHRLQGRTSRLVTSLPGEVHSA